MVEMAAAAHFKRALQLRRQFKSRFNLCKQTEQTDEQTCLQQTQLIQMIEEEIAPVVTKVEELEHEIVVPNNLKY